MEATTATSLDRESGAFQREAWAVASDELTAADQRSPLGAGDLERLAIASYLAGRDADSAAALQRAHRVYLREVDPARTARCAFWLGLALILRGEMARGGGWVARGQRLVDDGRLGCAERGFLLIPAAFATLFEGGAPRRARSSRRRRISASASPTAT